MHTSTYSPLGAVFAISSFACTIQTSSAPSQAPVVEAPPIAQAPPVASAPPPAENPSVQAPPASSGATPASSAPAPSSTVATAPLPSAPATRQRKSPPTNQRDCKKCNGDWGTHGLSQTPTCNCRTSDGGKRCRDGLECEGLCTAAEDPERQVTERGPPARGYFVGRCSTHAMVFGCYRPIDDGAGAQPRDLTEPPQTICAD